ncbi:hypothetical protein BOTBODRAFT_162195 [Botryobasidium botryosum FD-172 SS1]|uniref:RNA exonuclease 4 n=1 Tax=Botryobasidium botryosum (strain FD-172 SS1) TaxID=930990 RepID=A0A067MBE1_BOTB1|nr:hypothetical protein BOTBODRAFT_162195 [Botryobasidium botryosum FD-172 SS1]
MILGKVELPPSKCKTGKYLAIDCEMVGIGDIPTASDHSQPRHRVKGVRQQNRLNKEENGESSLARVSLVNFHGAIILDCFVRQKERVTDYRTFVSGIREDDLVGPDALPFDVVQKKVNELIQDRILVGHAVHNDLKALLLSHPAPLLRDTQRCPMIRKSLGTRTPGLKRIVDKELGMKIQAGEHSSIVDARATMAIYRMFKKEWEKSMPVASVLRKRKHDEVGKEDDGDSDGSDENEDEGFEDAEEIAEKVIGKRKWKGREKGKERKEKTYPGGGRKGISSGLGTVVKRTPAEKVRAKRTRAEDRSASRSATGGKSAGNWWEELGGKKAQRD